MVVVEPNSSPPCGKINPHDPLLLLSMFSQSGGSNVCESRSVGLQSMVKANNARSRTVHNTLNTALHFLEVLVRLLTLSTSAGN